MVRFAAWRRIALSVSLAAFLAAIGCGKSNDSPPAGHEVSGNAGADSGRGPQGGAGLGDDEGQAGHNDGDLGGSPRGGSAGRSNGGSAEPQPSSAGAAGNPDACEPTQKNCFEPCGGEWSGNWLLEETCFSGSAIGNCSGGRIVGSARSSQVLLRIPDGGAAEVTGRVTWDLEAHLPLSCLGLTSVDSCAGAQFFAGPTGPLLSSRARAWLPTCEAGACGGCNCTGEHDEDLLAAVRLPNPTYCVDGDVLWLGGHTTQGETKVSYKFRRRSCSGPGESCDFTTCGAVPGCTLGPPVVPRCTGEPSCSGAPAEECHEPGCSVRTCYGGADPIPCTELDASTCLKAPGCRWNGAVCSGTTRCIDQTSDDVCVALPYCDPLPYCGGTPEHTCSELSIAGCHALSCVIEW